MATTDTTNMEVTPITTSNSYTTDGSATTTTRSSYFERSVHGKPDAYKNIHASSTVPVEQYNNDSYITIAMKYLGVC